LTLAGPERVLTLSTVARPGRARRLARRTHDFLARSDVDGVARRSAAIALVIRLSSAGLAYVAQVVLARLMGQHEYGVFAYTWIWFLVFAAIATLGFGDSPVRYIAQLRERGEADHLRGFVRFAALAITASSTAFGIIIVAVLPLVDHWIDHVYIMPMALMAVSIPFACLQGYLEAIGRSYNWTIPALLPIYILRHGLLLLIMVAAIALGFAPTAVTAFICLALTMVLSIVYQAAAILTRLRTEIAPGPCAYRPKEWVRGSAPFAVLYSAQHLSSFADVLVLSFFVGPAEIAVYFAATRIIQVVNLVPFAATVGTAHLFSASHTRGDHQELQRLCRHVTAATFAIAALSVTGLVAAGDWLLGMFGQGFEAGYTPLVILALGVIARVAAGPAEDVLNMTGHGGLSAYTYLIVVALNVGLAMAFIAALGLNGAAIASAVALAVRAVWLALAAHRRLGVDTSVLALVPAALARFALYMPRRREIGTPAE
jgi:O-antigen/teichoic acid export membrane protein